MTINGMKFTILDVPHAPSQIGTYEDTPHISMLFVAGPTTESWKLSKYITVSLASA